jgi:ABC-type transport system involved in multi-copper enzyme maturation permease subunit
MTEPYLNISNITNLTYLECLNCSDGSSYIEDLERSVSISVFILFGFIFIAGLIGNGLVVLGKHNIIMQSIFYRHVLHYLTKGARKQIMEHLLYKKCYP